MKMCLSLALAFLVGASAAPGKKAIVPGAMMDALQAELNHSWSLAPLESAGPADFEESIALVPSWDLRKNMTHFMSVLARMPQGKLLQIDMTGYEWLNLSAVPARYSICNVHNSDVAIAEYVLGSILSWNIRLPQLDAELRRCTWKATDNTCQYPPAHVQAKGQTIGIIGYGHIGESVAVRAAALGMRVIAVTNRPPSVPPPPLAWIATDAHLPRLMQESDFVLVAVPLFPSTVGLVSSSAISHMKSSGVLINVARGPIVDETGLYEALEQRRIGGAILDVWWHGDSWLLPGHGPSAWPSQFNFSALSNVWMTPHVSYDTAESRREGTLQVAANLLALASGQALQNVVRNGSLSVPEAAARVNII